MAVTLTVILGKNTFYDVRDMRFVRLKQYDEILQGTVACTDIHTADILPDGLFHILQACSMDSISGTVSTSVSMVIIAR